MKYALDEQGEPVPETPERRAERSFTGPLRRVAQTHVEGCDVSTVFLIFNHNYGQGAPVLWETMIFGNAAGSGLDHWWDRCSGKRADAQAMHDAAVKMLRDYFATKDAPVKSVIRPMRVSPGPRKLILP